MINPLDDLANRDFDSLPEATQERLQKYMRRGMHYEFLMLCDELVKAGALKPKPKEEKKICEVSGVPVSECICADDESAHYRCSVCCELGNGCVCGQNTDDEKEPIE